MTKILSSIDKNKKISLKKTIQNTNHFILGIMIAPTLSLVILLLIVLGNYNRHLTNINRSLELNNAIDNQIDKPLWNLVIGNQPPDSIELGEMINNLKSDYSDFFVENENNIYLSSAQKSLFVIQQYINELSLQIESDASVFKQEKTYKNIQSIETAAKELLSHYVSNEEEIILKINRIVFITCIWVIILIFAIAGWLFLYSWISSSELNKEIDSRLQQFTNATQEIAYGNFDVNLSDCSLIELNELSGHLQTMSSNLKNLIEEKLEFRKELDKAEQRLLLEQIKPHFLYNTLSTIIWLAELEEYEKIESITRSLSNFLRISLNQGYENILISQEILHIKSYLEIQSIRYRSKLSYSIDIDSQIHDCYIGKMILQPFVENAIYHGIKEKPGGGSLNIRGFRADDSTLVFHITDCGAGMSEDKRQSLQDAIDKGIHCKDTGFGLYNVATRIRNFNNGNQTIKIESTLGKGTDISFTLPDSILEE